MIALCPVKHYTLLLGSGCDKDANEAEAAHEDVTLRDGISVKTQEKHV
jgi:hypothetical protein